MADSPLTLARLSTASSITDDLGRPLGAFVQSYNNSLRTITEAFATVLALTQSNQQTLARVSANVEAINALNGITSEQSQRLATLTNMIALADSYTVPDAILSVTSNGSTSTIVVARHQRLYSDGSAVFVDAGTISGVSTNTLFYVFYNDPSRSGGSVSYQASTSARDAHQANGIHSVGAVQT